MNTILIVPSYIYVYEVFNECNDVLLCFFHNSNDVLLFFYYILVCFFFS